MPAPQPPVILVDNVADRINLYLQATLRADAGFVVGREPQYAADYRRERTFFQTPSVLNPQLIADLGVGNSDAVDTVWIDRGHNLWGRTLHCDGSPDGHIVTSNDPLLFSLVVPAQGTVGGDPTTGWCVTEEGALYTFVTNTLARRSWRVYDTGTFAWILTGIIMGKRVQLSSPAGWSSIRDEDAGGRTERTTESDAAYQAVERVYAYRTLQLSLDLIGAAEYDASIRSLRSTLFERNQPAFIVMNYGDKPERGWLMQYQGKNWSSPMNRAHRKWTGTFREVGAVIR